MCKVYKVYKKPELIDVVKLIAGLVALPMIIFGTNHFNDDLLTWYCDASGLHKQQVMLKYLDIFLYNQNELMSK
jgi:hypothetical protein